MRIIGSSWLDEPRAKILREFEPLEPIKPALTVIVSMIIAQFLCDS